MVDHELRGDDRQRDDRQRDERGDDEPDVELPGDDVDGSDDFIADATGESYDELADRAQAVIDRAHAMEKPELEPDDASVAAQVQSARHGPDADERPA